MGASSQRRSWGVALALAALALGCPGKKDETARAGESPDASVPRASPRAGVKVPLPSGWSAQLAEDGSFQAGPKGHPVLRVDIRPGQAGALPGADALAEQVAERFKGYAVTVKQKESGEEVTLVRVELAPRLEDGGLGAQAPALFGAKRSGKDLFLCASMPGASEEEVGMALEACREIQVQVQSGPL